MTDEHPFGFTDFERREASGSPHAWAENDDVLVVETRISDHEEWVVTARYEVRVDGLWLVGLNIAPASLYPSPKSPISTPVLRGCHLGDLKQLARDWLSIREQVGLDIDTDTDEFMRNRRPGSVGRSDLFYTRVAFQYVELMKKGEKSPIMATLADQRNVSQSSARDLIHEARQRGLLTPTKRGQKGGELTERAKKLLAENMGNED